VFTARYALSPYIKQIRFVFKGLITNNVSQEAFNPIGIRTGYLSSTSWEYYIIIVSPVMADIRSGYRTVTLLWGPRGRVPWLPDNISLLSYKSLHARATPAPVKCRRHRHLPPQVPWRTPVCCDCLLHSCACKVNTDVILWLGQVSILAFEPTQHPIHWVSLTSIYWRS
jgi:hypothetical protein